jgi:hypothetical protein
LKTTLYACGYLFGFIFIMAMLLLLVGRILWWGIDLVYTFTAWLLS